MLLSLEKQIHPPITSAGFAAGGSSTTGSEWGTHTRSASRRRHVEAIRSFNGQSPRRTAISPNG
jgi:hypothetical protein